MIKSTYTLDVDTIRALEVLAHRWKVSKSEVLRRAIRAASGSAPAPAAPALAALDQLQRAVRLNPGQAARWAGRVRTGRRTASARRLRQKA